MKKDLIKIINFQLVYKSSFKNLIYAKNRINYDNFICILNTISIKRTILHHPYK